MKRRTLTPFLLVAVLGALGLFIWRRADGPPVPSGIVQLRDIDGVASGAFELPQGGRVVVEASGSAGADGRLEAFGWILDGATRRVVWRMTPEGTRAAEGTRRLSSDTLTLPAGTYEAHFSGVGTVSARGGAFARIANRRETWRNDRPLWYLTIRPLDGALANALRLSSGDDRPTPLPPLVWTSAPQTNTSVTQVLEVTRAAPVTLRFAGSEIGTNSRATLVRLPERTLVWEATAAASRGAGGGARNRTVEATVTLAPGLYEASADVVRGHGPGAWQQTPPDDPRAWGLAVSSAEAGAVIPFDAWRRTPAIRYTARTPDTEHIVDFTVSGSVAVFIDATGEITGDSDGSRADYGWLVNETTGERAWEMRRSDTEPAGGDGKNRRAETVLTLGAGRYTLHYVTDGSHHAGDFNSSAPTFPDRYGIALFALGDDAALTVTGRRDLSGGDSSVSSGPDEGTDEPSGDGPGESSANVPEPPSTNGSLASIVRVRSNANEGERFRLDTGGTVRVYATGERIGDSWYDWAEIEDERGEVVWSMKTARTQRGGGGDKNVLFDGTVALDAGSYRLTFTSDGSHNYGNYDDGAAPAHDFWGAIVSPGDTAVPIPQSRR